MNLRFNCKHQQIAEGIWVKESIIPVTLIGNSGARLNVTAILDSGSDFILLPLEVAEALNLAFGDSRLFGIYRLYCDTAVLFSLRS